MIVMFLDYFYFEMSFSQGSNNLSKRRIFSKCITLRFFPALPLSIFVPVDTLLASQQDFPYFVQTFFLYVFSVLGEDIHCLTTNLAYKRPGTPPPHSLSDDKSCIQEARDHPSQKSWNCMHLPEIY